MAKIWAIADLHLSLGTLNKQMDVFGTRWVNHTQRVKENWQKLVHPDDLVLIPGDISWGMSVEQAKPDLEWIHALPGTKVMIKGNHDYWWTSLKKIEDILPPSIHLIQNNAFVWNGIGIAGTRLWDDVHLNFAPFIEFSSADASEKAAQPPTAEELAETKKIYTRELARLETSLKAIPKQCTRRLVMTHYPPIGAHLESTAASQLLEKYKVEACVFGHLHSLKQGISLFGSHNGIDYIFAACDFLDCTPVQISV